MKRLLILTCAICLLLFASAPADAGIFGLTSHNFGGRFLGLGWGDGYHAACCCDAHSWCGDGCFSSQGCKGRCFGSECFGPKVVSPGCCGGGARVVPTYGGK